MAMRASWERLSGHDGDGEHQMKTCELGAWVEVKSYGAHFNRSG